MNKDVPTKPISGKTRQVAESIVGECDVGGDKVLSFWEVVTCWQLASTDEYVLYSLLDGNDAILRLYGACGNMYAVEYATDLPFSEHRTSVTDNRPWAVRAQLALALLDMVESLEDTPYGILYLCDVQESNFGIVRMYIIVEETGMRCGIGCPGPWPLPSPSTHLCLIE